MSKSIIFGALFILTLVIGCGGNSSSYINIIEYPEEVIFRGLTSYVPNKTLVFKVPRYPNSVVTVSPIQNSDRSQSHITLKLNKIDYLRNIESSDLWPESGLPTGENLPAKLGDGVGNGFTLPSVQIDQYDNGKIIIYQKGRKFGFYIPEKNVFNIKDNLTFSWKKDNYPFKVSIIGEDRDSSGVVVLFPGIINN